MSNAIDDKLLDEYLQGDSSFSRLYRAGETDVVPSELDRSVLAEARTAVGQRKAFRWQRVTPFLAVAATTVLTISIVIRSGVQWTPAVQEKTVAIESVEQEPLANAIAPPAIASPALAPQEAERANYASSDALKKELSRAKVASQPMPAAPEPQSEFKAAAPVVAADSVASTNEVGEVTVAAERRKESVANVPVTVAALESDSLRGRQSAVPRASAPIQPQLRRTDTAALEEVVTTAQRRAPTSGAVGPRSTMSPATSGGRANSSSAEDIVVTGQSRMTNRVAAGPRGTVQANPQAWTDLTEDIRIRESNPAAWLSYIRELRDAGNGGVADREWNRFVKAYPGYSVSESDRARPLKK